MTFFSLRVIELGGDARLVGIGWAHPRCSRCR